MKTCFEKSVRELTGKTDFTLSDGDFETFTELTENITFEPDTFERAVAFVAITVYGKAPFITQHGNRQEDLWIIANAFVFAWKMKQPGLSIESLLREKLSSDYLFYNAVIYAEEFSTITDLIFKPGQHQSTTPASKEPASMNNKLKEFLDFIVNPDNITNVDGYIASRKITDKDMVLNAGYINGSAYIKGIAHNHLVIIRYNYLERKREFLVNFAGKDLEKPVSKFALEYFFTNGVLLGHPDQPPVLRPTQDMHWYLWEAVRVDLATLRSMGIDTEKLYEEADSISSTTKKTGNFNEKLKERACAVEFGVERYRPELDKHYEMEAVQDIKA